MTRCTRLDDELIELLADEPELLAIADAFAETQRPRRRVRPVGVAACIAVAAAAVAFGFWSSNGSSGVSGNTAYAASGGQQRIVEMRVNGGSGSLLLHYDRAHGRLLARLHGSSLTVPAADLPPSAHRLAPAIARRLGAGAAPALTLLLEYPELAKSGHVEPSQPITGYGDLRWVSFRSALGYEVEVGLVRGALTPAVVLRRGAPGTIRTVSYVTSTG